MMGFETFGVETRTSQLCLPVLLFRISHTIRIGIREIRVLMNSNIKRLSRFVGWRFVSGCV